MQFHAIDYLIDSPEYYVLHDDSYKTITDVGLQTLPDFTLTAESIQANGFTDAQMLANIAAQLSSHIDLLRYSPDSANTAIAIKHLPVPQMIVMTGDIDVSAYRTIHGITLTTAGSNGAVKVVFSFDHGETWQTYAEGWQPIDCTAEALSANGMVAATLNSIPSEQWATANTGKLRIAFCLAKAAITDDMAVASLAITGDTAAWALASDDEYTYSYPGVKTMQIKLLGDGSYKINYTEQK